MNVWCHAHHGALVNSNKTSAHPIKPSVNGKIIGNDVGVNANGALYPAEINFAGLRCECGGSGGDDGGVGGGCRGAGGGGGI